MTTAKHLRRSIFVVDDEQLIVESLAHILRREGFRVNGFTDPVKALAQTKTTAPDLLISDVMMPELTGIQLANEVRRTVPKCKILLFSAAADELPREATEKKVRIGFRLLSKPLHPDKLLGEIESLLQRCETSPVQDRVVAGLDPAAPYI